ncbi:hypothetical protein TNIN_264931 [Trichonephila inaurata madagascariensis]|uniref:Uncharacterized protein n=1 Tax=Trichonephila inaurata madagascariensis TaxID=2747483 RepID=A0A8X7C9I7_9ARAC|nr:hypothetical protein TNIN_264931 [Trichonephila inaurata madagascariensis]
MSSNFDGTPTYQRSMVLQKTVSKQVTFLPKYSVLDKPLCSRNYEYQHQFQVSSVENYPGKISCRNLLKGRNTAHVFSEVSLTTAGASGRSPFYFIPKRGAERDVFGVVPWVGDSFLET